MEPMGNHGKFRQPGRLFASSGRNRRPADRGEGESGARASAKDL